MAATKTCDNPKCTCDPCTCVDCTCGVPRIGDLERRVMEVLWEDPGTEVTGRCVADQLPDYAYTTVATVLDRMVQKGLVARRMEGRTIRFASTGTRADHSAELMHETLVTTGDPESVLIRFIRKVSGPEAATLRRALDELDR